MGTKSRVRSNIGYLSKTNLSNCKNNINIIVMISNNSTIKLK